MGKLFTNQWLRRIAMPLLKASAFDLSMAHPWVPKSRFRLNSFRHKGYWYHGRARELGTMRLFEELIRPQDTVVEVGGHIGFITMYLAKLVGVSGKVVVFEPGSNNLPYLRHNTRSLATVQIVEQAVSSEDGMAVLHEESLTGQNNSLVASFQGFAVNAAHAYVDTDVCSREVPIVSLDTFFHGVNVDFVKIDIEGHEYAALRGAEQLLHRCHPKMMVEIQADQSAIYDMLSELGYRLFNDRMHEHRSPETLRGNVFCLHSSHAYPRGGLAV